MNDTSKPSTQVTEQTNKEATLDSTRDITFREDLMGYNQETLAKIVRNIEIPEITEFPKKGTRYENVTKLSTFYDDDKPLSYAGFQFALEVVRDYCNENNLQAELREQLEEYKDERREFNHRK